MIARIFSSLFLGFILISIPDFLLFLGMKLHYFDFYKINEYFNIYFFDNQPVIFLIIISFFLAYLMFFTPLKKTIQILYICIVLISATSLFSFVGQKIGEFIFTQKDLTYKIGKVKFGGDLLYQGRNFTYVYRQDLKRTIKIKNNELEILN